MHLRLEVHLFFLILSHSNLHRFSCLQTQAGISSARAYHDDATFEIKKNSQKSKESGVGVRKNHYFCSHNNCTLNFLNFEL